MKKTTIMMSVLLALTGFSATAQKVDIQWQNVDNYTDIELGYSTERKKAQARKEVLEVIQKYFDFAAQNSLPEGYTVKVNMTDVDLAGNTLFNENSGLYKRTIKHFNFPELAFDYELLNEGKVVKAGSVTLNGNLISEATLRNKSNQSRFAFEKKLIKDWFNKELKHSIAKA